MLNSILTFIDIGLLWILIMIEVVLHWLNVSRKTQSILLKVAFVVIVLMGLVITADVFVGGVK